MKRFVLLLLVYAAPAAAQDMPGMDMKDMPGMTMPAKKPPPRKSRPKKSAAQPAAQAAPQPSQMPGMAMPSAPSPDMPPAHHDMDMQTNGTAMAPGMDMGHGMAMHGLLGGYAMSREASGTSWQPDAAPHSGIHLMADDWMVMLHGRVNGIADWQSGPRGSNQVFSTSMLMAMATRDLANGDTLGLKAMLSGDPFMGRRGYPLLLASGETADGATHLVDRQHPHDLLMELAASYSHPLSADDSVFLYGGYPGEPALGPSAYMHRISAEDNPMTPIAHHWLDSTHVTFGVVTAGFVHDGWKLEVSQFTGREPDQYRFDFDKATFDSTSARLTWNPDSNWSLQISGGHLKSPEQLEPDVDEDRITASATYYNAFEFGSVAATIAFGHKHLTGGVNEDAGLLEAEYKPHPLWTLFARAETIGSDELAPEPGVRHAGELSFGVIKDWRLAEHWKFGVGGLYAFDFAPGSTIKPYGDDPHGVMGFVRVVAE
ncbi:MAG TPA: hypothetical protein VGC16_01230 [Rhizomicrobium sp.]